MLLFVADANYMRFLQYERTKISDGKKIEKMKNSQKILPKSVKSDVETAQKDTKKLNPGAIIVISKVSKENEESTISDERKTAGSDVYAENLNPFEDVCLCSSDEIRFSSTESEPERSNLSESINNKLEVRKWSFFTKNQNNATSPTSDANSEFLM